MNTRVPAPVAAMRKTPRQQRSRAMVAAIVEAAARVLAETGWAAFTTGEVARVAGVSIGSLYQYFPDKRALAEAVRARHLDQILDALDAARDPAEGTGSVGQDDRVTRMIDGIVAAHRVDPRLHRVLLEQVPLSDRGAHPAFERRYHALYEEAVEETLGASDRQASRVHSVLAAAVEGVVHDAVRRDEHDWPALRHELRLLVRGYLSA